MTQHQGAQRLPSLCGAGGGQGSAGLGWPWGALGGRRALPEETSRQMLCEHKGVEEVTLISLKQTHSRADLCTRCRMLWGWGQLQDQKGMSARDSGAAGWTQGLPPYLLQGKEAAPAWGSAPTRSCTSSMVRWSVGGAQTISSGILTPKGAVRLQSRREGPSS